MIYVVGVGAFVLVAVVGIGVLLWVLSKTTID